MTETALRLRAILDARLTVVVAVLLVLGLVGAGVAYDTHVDPETTTEERTVSSWTVTASHTHSATVTEENPVFPVGTELSDRSTYFTRISPELDGEVSVEYAASAASDVAVTVDVALVLRSADEETVYWSDEQPLAAAERTAEPGEAVTVPFTLNASAVEARLTAIEEDLGSTPGETAVFVRTDVAVEGVVDGEDTEYARTLQLPLTIEGDTYTVGETGQPTDTIAQTETVQVPRSDGPLRTVGAPVLLFGSLLLLGGLVLARQKGRLELDDAERAYLDYRDDRAEFEEWITRIRLPPEAFDGPEATAASLGDLVDYAIDTDQGVIEDPETGQFHVWGEQYLFTYRPPTGPAEKNVQTASNPDKSDEVSRESSNSGDDPEQESAEDPTTEAAEAATGTDLTDREDQQ